MVDHACILKKQRKSRKKCMEPTNSIVNWEKKNSNIKEATSREVKPLSLRSSIQGYIFNKYLHKFRSKYVVLCLGFKLLNPKAKQIPNWSPRLWYWKTRICIQKRALDIQQRISICFRTSKCVNIFTACMATLFVETLRHIH